MATITGFLKALAEDSSLRQKWDEGDHKGAMQAYDLDRDQEEIVRRTLDGGDFSELQRRCAEEVVALWRK
jgi:hypothetical protein